MGAIFSFMEKLKGPVAEALRRGHEATRGPSVRVRTLVAPKRP